MSLKHNPNDNSNKGSLIRRKKVFETPAPEESPNNVKTDSTSPQESKTSLKQHENITQTETRTSLEHHSNEQSDSNEHIENISKTETKTVLETSLKQNSNISKTSSGFAAVVGIQRKILDYFFARAQNLGSRTTGKIFTEELAEMLVCSVETVRTSVQRLEKKGFVFRQEFKRGRGGFSVFEIGLEAYQNLLLHNITKTTFKQHDNITNTQTKTETKTSLSSSSRDFYLNNSTTTEDVDNSDAGHLKNLDFSIVTEFGITSSTLNRCRELYPSVSNDQLAALIERFGQFMKTQDAKRVQNARGFFISLAEQLSKGVTPLDHIETNSEALMREFVERAKEAKARREMLEKEASEFAFEEWIENLDSKARDELVPPNSVIESGSKIQTIKLKEHFRLNVWPTKFAEFN